LAPDDPQVNRNLKKIIRKKKGREFEATLTEDKDALLREIQGEFGLSESEKKSVFKAPSWPVIIGVPVTGVIAVISLLFVLTRPDTSPPPEISAITIFETEARSLKGTIPPVQGEGWADFSHGIVTISELDSSVVYEARFEKNGLAFEVPAAKIKPDSPYQVKVVTVDHRGNVSQGLNENLITRVPEVKNLTSRFEDGVILWEWSEDAEEGHLRISGPGGSLLVAEDFAGVHSYALPGADFKTGAVYTAAVQKKGSHGLSSGVRNSFTIPDTRIFQSLPFSGRAEKTPVAFRDQIKKDGLTKSSTKFIVEYKYDAQSETNHAKNRITVVLYNVSGRQIGETKNFLFNSTSARDGPWWEGGWVAESAREEVWEMSYEELAQISSISVTIRAGDWVMAVDEFRCHFE
jgi:hypothetical protein